MGGSYDSTCERCGETWLVHDLVSVFGRLYCPKCAKEERETRAKGTCSCKVPAGLLPMGADGKPEPYPCLNCGGMVTSSVGATDPTTAADAREILEPGTEETPHDDH